MISEYEAAKLRRDMEKDMTHPSTTLIRCSVGLLVVVLLAVVSPSLGTEEGANGAPATTSAGAAADL